MLKSLLAVAAMSLPAAALVAQAPESQPRVQPAQWTLAGGTQGCAVHASSPQGTVVSILAGAGQEDLLFLVQNPRWSLRTVANMTSRSPSMAASPGKCRPWRRPKSTATGPV
jgi:hypothetical protein